MSFRRVSTAVVPGVDRCKRVVVVAGAVALGGCGGGGGGERLVYGTGYTFEAPKGWEIVRTARQVEAAQGHGSAALVAVSRFSLLRPFRPALWNKVVRELDDAADAIAVAIVIPADGPSLGTAPAGTWMCTSWSENH